jgi:hypothetical protein
MVHAMTLREIVAADDSAPVTPEPEVARKRKRSPRHKGKPDQLRLWDSGLKP